MLNPDEFESFEAFLEASKKEGLNKGWIPAYDFVPDESDPGAFKKVLIDTSGKLAHYSTLGKRWIENFLSHGRR